MVNFYCTIIPVVILLTHTSAWFLDREIHQLVVHVSICTIDISNIDTLLLTQVWEGYPGKPASCSLIHVIDDVILKVLAISL